MKINEAAKALGVTAQTLRYYERIGLIGRVTRRSGGSAIRSLRRPSLLPPSEREALPSRIFCR